MKNILKKIGLIGIIIGVLSPFITLPKVSATNNANCKYYLNQYLFLDTFSGAEIEDYEKNATMIGKRNFTSFIYTFEKPTEDSWIEITKHGSVNLNNEIGMEEYFNAYAKFINERDVIERKDIAKFGAWEQTSSGYENVITLVHGKWGEHKEGNVEISEWSEYSDKDAIYSRTIHKAIGDKVTLTTNLGGAFLKGTKFGLPGGNYNNDLKSYMNQVITDFNSQSLNSTSYTNNYLVTENNETYFNVNILREISKDDLKKVTFGYEDGSTKKVFSTEEGEGKATNSYEAYENSGFKESDCTSAKNCYLNEYSGTIDYDIKRAEPYLWPSLYNIEYKVCTQSNSWMLSYDNGVTDDSVTNMPNPSEVSDLTDNKVKLSDTKPERTGYVFKGWCTEKDGKGTCKQPGEEMPNADKIDMIVHAFWLEEGTKDPDKYGVMSYVIAFSVVGLIATGLYYGINKKNLFKQI